MKWKLKPGQPLSSIPAIAADAIYFGSQDRYFYALRPDGGTQWKLWTDGSLASSPAIKEDGVVLVSLKTACVIALQDHNGGPALSAWPMWLSGVRKTADKVANSRCSLHYFGPESSPLYSHSQDWRTNHDQEYEIASPRSIHATEPSRRTAAPPATYCLAPPLFDEIWAKSSYAWLLRCNRGGRNVQLTGFLGLI